MARYFTNPANQYSERATTPLTWLWVCLFGCLYFLLRGVWAHALILCAAQILWFVAVAPPRPANGLEFVVFALFAWVPPAIPYAVLVYPIMNKIYRRRGWSETTTVQS